MQVDEMPPTGMSLAGEGRPAAAALFIVVGLALFAIGVGLLAWRKTRFVRPDSPGAAEPQPQAET